MITAKITVTGIVQGVGFRPFIYNTAAKLKLNGTVKNDSSGVEIILQGTQAKIDELISAIKSDHPLLSKVDTINVALIETTAGYDNFTIIESESLQQKTTRISPDAAVCPECLAELFDPDNRRFYYPYINCTHCGPRYTIIKDIPYDRKNTTMAEFIMCKNCQTEYDDPLNRRFHAQPNACFDCGPLYSLSDSEKNIIIQGDTIQAAQEMIKKAAEMLRSGKIIAIKGIGGFHLAVNACDAAAVHQLRKKKYREKKPFAVMAGDVKQINAICNASALEIKRLQHYDRPILLLENNKNNLLADEIAPDNDYLGVMLPYTPLQYLIFAAIDFPLVMTSANTSDEPISFQNNEAYSRLNKIADFFLTGNRHIHIRTDDSVLRIWRGHDFLLRRARGFVPNPVGIYKTFSEPVFGAGAELKNTVCLGFDSQLFLSHHIGDLKNKETYESFVQAADHFTKIYEKYPKIIGHDLNEQYLSTQAVKNPPEKLSWMKDCRLIPIQHHHAHIASCMAEHGLKDKVIGIVYDGTGLGTDNTVWGGEILVADYISFSREAYLRPVMLYGGDAAVKSPWRSAVSYIWQCASENFKSLLSSGLLAIESEKMEMMLYQCSHQKGIPCSSAGRLFDAVSAIAGICLEADYDGQAAIELEQKIKNIDKTEYKFDLVHDEITGAVIMDWKNVIMEAVQDAAGSNACHDIAFKFHKGLVSATIEAVEHIHAKTGISHIVLTGGCFMNRFLSSALLEYFEQRNYLVYTHRQIPCNDGGISAGQAVIAHETAAEEKK